MATRKRSNSGFNVPSTNIMRIVVLLTLVFIGLKLAGITEVSSWNWWWVLSPLWLPSALLIVLLLFLRWYEKS